MRMRRHDPYFAGAEPQDANSLAGRTRWRGSHRRNPTQVALHRFELRAENNVTARFGRTRSISPPSKCSRSAGGATVLKAIAILSGRARGEHQTRCTVGTKHSGSYPASIACRHLKVPGDVSPSVRDGAHRRCSSGFSALRCCTISGAVPSRKAVSNRYGSPCPRRRLTSTLAGNSASREILSFSCNLLKQRCLLQPVRILTHPTVSHFVEDNTACAHGNGENPPLTREEGVP
jgi:hypothetical protein